MIDASVEQLEQRLDDFKPAKREKAFVALIEKVKNGELTYAATETDVNLHFHTLFSYNSNDYAPSKIAWLTRKKGLTAACVVDFDVFNALDEFLSASKAIGLKACAGFS
jgi:hypothetical protein